MKLAGQLLQIFRRAATTLLVDENELVNKAMARIEDKTAITAALGAEGFHSSDIALVMFRASDGGQEDERGVFAKAFRKQGISMPFPQWIKIPLNNERVPPAQAAENSDALVQRVGAALHPGMIMFETTQGQGAIAVHPGYYEAVATDEIIPAATKWSRATPVTTLVCNVDASGESDFNVAGRETEIAKRLGKKITRASRNEVFENPSISVRYSQTIYPFLES